MKNSRLSQTGLTVLGSLVFLQVASAADNGRFRYSCVAPDGQSILIENQKLHEASYLYKVNGWADGQAQWTSMRASRDVKADDEYIVFPFKTSELLPACNPDRHPVIGETTPGWHLGFGLPHYPMMAGPYVALPGAVITYGDSCYGSITNEVRVDSANPSDAEIVLRDLSGAEVSRSPLHCSDSYTKQATDEIEQAAKKNFGPTGPSGSTASQPSAEDGSVAKAVAVQLGSQAAALAAPAAVSAQ